jgi:hypothetical protein
MLQEKEQITHKEFLNSSDSRILSRDFIGKEKAGDFFYHSERRKSNQLRSLDLLKQYFRNEGQRTTFLDKGTEIIYLPDVSYKKC